MSSADNQPPSRNDQPRSQNDQPRTSSGAGAETGRTVPRPVTSPATSRDLVRAQKDRFGGMKFGACFFGWLTATGTAVLLTGLLTAVGAGVGYNLGYSPGQAGANAPTIGLVSAIVLLVVILVAYYCGGYVASRMARFNGLKQGLGVWLWAVVVAVVVAVLVLIAGDRFNVLSNLGGMPALPASTGNLTTGAIISAAAVLVVSLVGALLGGLAGMRYHRRIDHATFEENER